MQIQTKIYYEEQPTKQLIIKEQVANVKTPSTDWWGGKHLAGPLCSQPNQGNHCQLCWGQVRKKGRAALADDDRSIRAGPNKFSYLSLVLWKKKDRESA